MGINRCLEKNRKVFTDHRDGGISQAGFGLIEVLIGAAIIAAIATSLGFYSSLLSSAMAPSSVNTFSCVVHGTSVLSKLRSLSGQFSVSPFVPFESNRTPSSLFSAPAVVPNSVLWSSVPAVSSDEASPFIYSGSLYSGPVRIFNSMYNRTDIDFCSQFATSPEIASISETVAAGANTRILGTVTSSLRVRLYELSSGTVLPDCEKPIWINSKSIAPGDPNRDAVQAGFVRRNPDQVRSDVGILLELQTDYLDTEEVIPGAEASNPQIQSCVVSDRLVLGLDNSGPSAPIISVTGLGTPAANGANANQGSATVSVTATGNGDNTILVCRDRSVRTTQGAYECYSPSNPGPGPQHTAGTANSYAVAAPVPSQLETTYSGFGSTRPASWVTPTWVPCERVTLCGRSPISTSLTTLTNAGYTITNSYQQLASDCVARVEAAAMDSAGNLNISPASPYNPSQISSSATGFTTSLRPTCGSWCGPSMPYWPAGANGYWQFPSCCVGAGCVRGGGTPLSTYQ